MRETRRDNRLVYNRVLELLKNQSQLAIEAKMDRSPTIANIAAVIIVPTVNDIIALNEILSTDECRHL